MENEKKSYCIELDVIWFWRFDMIVFEKMERNSIWYDMTEWIKKDNSECEQYNDECFFQFTWL